MISGYQSKIKMCDLYFHDGFVYIPTIERLKNGMRINVEPVIRINIAKTEIVEVVEKMRTREINSIPVPRTKEELRRISANMPNQLKLPSWKRLYQDVSQFSICWNSVKNNIVIYVMEYIESEKKGLGNAKTIEYPFDTNSEKIVDVILNEYEQRMEKSNK